MRACAIQYRVLRIFSRYSRRHTTVAKLSECRDLFRSRTQLFVVRNFASSSFPMPSIFGRKKSTTTANTTNAASAAQSGSPIDTSSRPSEEHRTDSSPRSPSTRSDQKPASPVKKSRGAFVRERDRDKRPEAQRSGSSRSFLGSGRASTSGRKASETHPLNLPPDELRRLSALSFASMSGTSGDDAAVEQPQQHSQSMEESTPPPQTPGAFPQANGVNGGSQQDGDGPSPPPHQMSTSSPPPPPAPPEAPQIDAEKCKQAGNDFYKAKQYDQAIEEYTKGLSTSHTPCRDAAVPS